MKIIQINNTDLAGQRFNGYDLQRKLNDIGIDAKQLVYSKQSDDKNVISFAEPSGLHIRRFYNKFEQKLSIHGLIYPYGRQIMKMKEFIEADVVHYHLIHNHILSLLDFVKMAAKKPSIWSLHDPWALTGHCIYPMECERWKTGCRQCPNLERIFSIGEDKANQLWKLKEQVYKNLDINIIVYSEWMKGLLEQSPLMQQFKKIHFFSFGINIDKFARDKELARQSLNLDKEEFVILFRSDDNLFKGLAYIKNMLRQLSAERKITLLTVGKVGLLNEFQGKYKINELGWITDETQMPLVYAAADLFLMPSIAEAFGLMAIEAMASSLPIIVFDGTALTDIAHCPQCGISLPKGDISLFSRTVERLMFSQAERLERGELGRKIAERYYNENDYFSKMLALYEEIHHKK